MRSMHCSCFLSNQRRQLSMALSTTSVGRGKGGLRPPHPDLEPRPHGLPHGGHPSQAQRSLVFSSYIFWVERWGLRAARRLLPPWASSGVKPVSLFTWASSSSKELEMF